MEPARHRSPVGPDDAARAADVDRPAVPTPNDPNEKWEANREKVAFARAFPGRLASWADAVGRTVEAVVPSGNDAVVLFADGAFLIAPNQDPEPAALLAALAAARPRLAARHGEAFGALDRLTDRDRELTRRAKLNNILGAIRHNAAEIPELKEAVRRLLDNWDGAADTHGKTK